MTLTRYWAGYAEGHDLDIGDTWGYGASLFEIRLGLVTKLVNQYDRDRALADLGLEQLEFQEVRDLGNGVAFAVAVQSARLAGSTGLVRGRYAVVSAWADGLIKQITNYPYSDRNEARADAERLAEERG